MAFHRRNAAKWLDFAGHCRRSGARTLARWSLAQAHWHNRQLQGN